MQSTETPLGCVCQCTLWREYTTLQRQLELKPASARTLGQRYLARRCDLLRLRRCWHGMQLRSQVHPLVDATARPVVVCHLHAHLLARHSGISSCQSLACARRISRELQ